MVRHCRTLVFVKWMSLIESSLFSKLIGNYLDDDEYSELQEHLVKHPNSGDVVPKSGGVRKLRWKVAGKGKSGGIRVIYFLRAKTSIFLLTVYSKSEESNIPGHMLRKIKKELTDD